MQTIKLTISYDGTAYSGWQLQPNGRTIQGEVEKAIEKIYGKHHRLYGASRTDAGVHAKAQAAHYRTDLSIPLKKIPIALTSVLPEDIAVTKAEPVDDDFHARFDPRSKIYRYSILISRYRDPLREKYLWRIPYELDVAKMRREACVLLGRHDFKSFQARDKKERSSVRTVSKLSISRKGPLISLVIEADGFLYNMVRTIVGTLVDTGRGYLPAGSMKKILKSKDRTKAGPTAPAKGLILEQVRY